MLILTVATLALFAQSAQRGQDSGQVTNRSNIILIEEEIFEADIEIRVPEGAVLPRRRVEEISYSLRFLQEQFIKSNRLLY